MTDQTPEASAVEALADLIAVHATREADSGWCECPWETGERDADHAAKVIIRSDWLAEHTRRAQARVLRETAANIPAQVAIASHVRSRINLWLHADADRIENGDSRG